MKPKAYNHLKIEKKWQKEWEAKKVYETTSPLKAKSQKLKPMYVLDMFPYPSGAGLHVGHPRGYIGSDVFARMKRMEGFNVLHPMGYDAFGLPAEQYAVQHKIHPREAVEKNVATFEKQLSIIGLSYDWSRKVNTTDPEYYKWTQWIFLKLYGSWYQLGSSASKSNEMRGSASQLGQARPIEELVKIFEKEGNGKVSAWTTQSSVFSSKEWKEMNEKEKQDVLMKYRLAYEGNAEVNWCPELGTVLANDEIVDGPNGEPVSERGGYPVEKKSMRQWFMRITAYADRLISGLEDLDWPNNIKEIQRNWIGKSEGLIFSAPVKGTDLIIETFSAHFEACYADTFVVIAPDHPLLEILTHNIDNQKEILSFSKAIVEKRNQQGEQYKEITGIFTGRYIIDPLGNGNLPIWVASFALANYGTGIVKCSCHDERDFAFAKKYNIHLKPVLFPKDVSLKEKVKNLETCYTNTKQGILNEPNEFEGKIASEVREQIASYVVQKGFARRQTNYKMRDAIFARQRYWGEPIPLIHKDPKSFPAKVSLSFYNQENWQDILLGQKTVESRALNPEEPDRYFGNVAIGDILELVNKKTKQKIYVEVKDVYSFKNLEQLFINKEILSKIRPIFKYAKSINELKSFWDSFGKGYLDKVQKNGLVAWKIERIQLIETVSEKNLPLELPNVKSYEPTGTGESPLSGVKSWTDMGYETNTMPGWAGSSWYFLRYMDPKNKKEIASKEAMKYWGDVDMYVGGAEHATGHLLYSRFWNKFLYDIGIAPTEEPFKALRNQGMIGGSDNRKMSKRWGNVVNPDEVVKNYGADSLRVFEMFLGPFDSHLPWSTEGIIGSRRFIEKVWRIGERINNEQLTINNEKKIGGKRSDIKDSKGPTLGSQYEKTLHKTIKKVTEDILSFNFNTAISAMMMCVNEMEKAENISAKDFKKFLQILAPFAPHITEEIWHSLGEKKSIHKSGWPKYDPEKIIDAEITIVVQVNGKVRGTLVLDAGSTEKVIEEAAHAHPSIIPWLVGKSIAKVIHVPAKLINFVLKNQ